MRDALSDPEKAFVLLTRNGKPMTKTQIYKMVRRIGVKVEVGLRKAPSEWDAGVTVAHLSGIERGYANPKWEMSSGSRRPSASRWSTWRVSGKSTATEGRRAEGAGWRELSNK